MENEKRVTQKPFGIIGLIGRWKPLHIGGYSLLEAVCEKSDKVLIGIGSSNRYDLRNPFTAQETEEMIRISLSPKHSNYRIIHIPDFCNEDKWVKYVLKKFGKLDCYVSGNQYVNQLLETHYKIIHPFDIIPKEKQVELNSTKVRIEIARGGDWKKLVPNEVSEYLESSGLIERFIREFGKETLEKSEYKPKLNAGEEKLLIQ